MINERIKLNTIRNFYETTDIYHKYISFSLSSHLVSNDNMKGDLQEIESANHSGTSGFTPDDFCTIPVVLYIFLCSFLIP